MLLDESVDCVEISFWMKVSLDETVFGLKVYVDEIVLCRGSHCFGRKCFWTKVFLMKVFLDEFFFLRIWMKVYLTDQCMLQGSTSFEHF